MPGLGLRVLMTALAFAAMPHGAFAQAGRVGGVAPAAPPFAAPPAPAPAPVVPAAPAVPMVHSFAPPAAHAFSPPAAVALPQVHVPSVGAVARPAPHVGVPLGSTGIHPGVTGRISPTPPAPSLTSRAAGVVATPPAASNHHVRHHRRPGINTGMLWGDPGTCWVWRARPGHRRLRLHRCS